LLSCFAVLFSTKRSRSCFLAIKITCLSVLPLSVLLCLFVLFIRIASENPFLIFLFQGEFDGYSFLYSHFKDYKPFGLLYESLLLCASAFFSAVQVEHQNAQGTTVSLVLLYYKRTAFFFLSGVCGKKRFNCTATLDQRFFLCLAILYLLKDSFFLGCLGSVPFSSVDAHFFRVLNFVFEVLRFC
jgi:hypothetical protein